MPHGGVSLVCVRNSKEINTAWVEWIGEKGVNDEVREVKEMIVYIGLWRLLPTVSWIVKIKNSD